MTDRIRAIAGQAVVAGLLMTFYGWFMSGKGISSSTAYNTMVDVFYWMLRVGGPLLLVGAAICYTGMRAGALFDGIVTGVCGLVMIAYGISGLPTGVGVGLNNMLALIFGALFISSARRSLAIYGHSRAESAPTERVAVQIARPVEPVHPASVHPDVMPGVEEPPPPDGYLAALSREKDEPPTASFE